MRARAILVKSPPPRSRVARSRTFQRMRGRIPRSFLSLIPCRERTAQGSCRRHEPFFPEAALARDVFCPNDKSMMRPMDGVLTCPKCGHKQAQAAAGKNVVKQKATEDVHKSVIDHGTKKMDLLPTTNEYACEKCGHGTAYYFMRQTRSADEATTRFLECTKCGNKWREYR